MKFLIVTVFVSFVSFSAMAMDISLTRSSNNGTVAPEYQIRTTCFISNSIVKIVNAGGSVFLSHTLLKQAVFTDEVPNQAVMESLSGDASRAPVESFPGPIGGSVISDTVTIDAGSAYLSVKSGNIVVKQNHSDAAEKLVRFLDKNCN
jgi:hypothetical protein